MMDLSEIVYIDIIQGHIHTTNVDSTLTPTGPPVKLVGNSDQLTYLSRKSSIYVCTLA